VAEYLPIVGVCGQVDDTYVRFAALGEITASDTSTDWTVVWSAEPVGASMRWTATFTALIDLPYNGVAVIGAAFSSDGGLGDGPPPSATSPSTAIDPALSAVSGVTLNPLSSDPTVAWVTIAGSATFAAGATLTIAFTVPNVGLPTSLALLTPLIDSQIAEVGLFVAAVENASDEDISLAWTGTCCECDVTMTVLNDTSVPERTNWQWQWDEFCGTAGDVFVAEWEFIQDPDATAPPSPVPTTGWSGAYPPNSTFTLPVIADNVAGSIASPLIPYLYRIVVLVNDCERYTFHLWSRSVTIGVVDAYLSVDGGVTWVDAVTGAVL
jgi:hypothetical protein